LSVTNRPLVFVEKKKKKKKKKLLRGITGLHG